MTPSILTLNRNSTVGDVARKVMGDVPISYIEGVGGTRVSEDDIVAVGKHDVGLPITQHPFLHQSANANCPSRYCPSRSDDKSSHSTYTQLYAVSIWNRGDNVPTHSKFQRTPPTLQ